MLAVEITVAIISTIGTILIGPLIGLYIKKKCPDDKPEPDIPKVCQIQDTELLKVAGFPIYNNKYCDSDKIKCDKCGLYFCDFHHPVNNNGDLNGGHVCKPVNP